jgi:hypothetical protein
MEAPRMNLPSTSRPRRALSASTSEATNVVAVPRECQMHHTQTSLAPPTNSGNGTADEKHYLSSKFILKHTITRGATHDPKRVQPLPKSLPQRWKDKGVSERGSEIGTIDS